MKKHEVKTLLSLPEDERERLVNLPDPELGEALKNLGVALPAGRWWLVLIKAALIAVGYLLAGLGTAAASNLFV